MVALSHLEDGLVDGFRFLPFLSGRHCRHVNRPAPKATLPRKKREPNVIQEDDGTYSIVGLTVADIAEMRDLLRPSARLFAPTEAAALTAGLDPRICPKCCGTGQKFAYDHAAGHVRPYRCECGAGFDRTRAVKRFLDGGEGVQG